MKSNLFRLFMPCLLLVLMAFPLRAARQSHTLTSTFTGLSEGMLIASENGCSWTPSPYNGFYHGQMGFAISSKISASEETKITSAYTITGTIQSIKLTACGTYYKVKAKAGNTILDSLVVGGSDKPYSLVEQTIPITATDVTNQSVTLVFSLNDNVGQQQWGFCEFTKVVVTYLDPKVAAGLSFSSASATATIGESLTLPTLNNPNKLSVSWSSSNTSVATVSNTGVVTLVKDGTATITASFSGNNDYLAGSASYTLTVKAPTLTAPTFSLAAGTYDKAQSLTLSTTKQGADIYYSIDNGSDQKYTGPISISKSCTVKAYTQLMGYKSTVDSRTYIVRVAASLSFSSQSVTVALGNSFTPPVLNNPNKLPVTWTSSNTGVATVNSSGAVTILKMGTTRITATFAGDAQRLPASTYYTLTVDAPSLAPPSFSIESGSYDAAQSLTLSTETQGAEIYYAIDNGSYQKYTRAITINKSCTVNAYTQLAGYKSIVGSKTYVFRQASSISFSPTSATATIGEPFTAPKLNNPNNFRIIWSSSNTKVARVSDTGVVSLLKDGTATITASFDGDTNYKPCSASYALTVKAPNMVPPTFSLEAGNYGTEQTLTLSTTLIGAEIYYSVNKGGVRKYIEPIAISNTCTINAYTQIGDYKSTTESRRYSILKTATLSFASNSVSVTLGHTFKAPVLNNPEQLPLTWSSSNTNVATVSAGNVTIKAVGETTITAAFEGDNQYMPVSASYRLIVENDPDPAYMLWVNGIRVTDSNRLDVLGDGKGKDNPSVMFDGVHTLVLSNANIESIVSQLPDRLVIFVQGDNKVTNNGTTPAICHTGNVRIPLTITTSGNYPGTLTIASNSTLTDGFSQTIADHIMVLSDDSRKAVYGPRIYPFTNNAVITFRAPDFLIPGAGGESEEIDLSNRVVNNVLYTLHQENEDGFWEDENSMVLNTVMPQNPSFGDGVVGSASFAENFSGMTLMIPAGEGDIIIDNMSTQGYVMGVKIGSGQSYTYSNSSWTQNTIHYKVSVPSYVHIYNAGLSGGASDRLRGGKKTTTRIVVHSIVIKPQNISSSNEVQGIIPSSQTIDMNPVIVDTHISDLYVNRKNAGSWYNLNGQQMDRPLQRGIYILNGRKVVVK